MKCYICEKTQESGGMHYDIHQAVGICQHCGIGVCIEHSHKDAELGSPLLCKSCAELAMHQAEVSSLAGVRRGMHTNAKS